VYAEDELLPVSGLQHLLFCERQAALIHVEQLWSDNALTIEGSHLHARVDEEAPRREVRGDRVILRGLALRSLRLGLVGRADVVELHRCRPGEDRDDRPGLGSAVSVARLPGLWAPFPVDYKRGKPKRDYCDEVQLCAQALCLEEMLSVSILEGALFYGRQQRRHAVAFDGELRQLTEDAARRFHELIATGETPRAAKSPECKRCSLVELCVPEIFGRRRSARRYLDAAVSEVVNPGDGG
jgi:CRISPR-associated exonuclease Cas4